MTETTLDACLEAPHRIDPGFGQDPYPFLNALREAGPVHRVLLPDGSESWWVTGYDEVNACLEDHDRFSSQVHNAVADKRIQNSQALIRKDDMLRLVMINRDPPDHTRMRKLVVRAFGATEVARLRPRIEQIADRLLDGMAGRESAELVQDYAFPVPVNVICLLLGIPYSDSAVLGGFVTRMVGASGPEEALAAIGGLKEFMTEKIAEKRAHPADDILTSLVRATDDGTLHGLELPAMALQILSAGHESSIFLISAGVFNLLRNPEQLAAVRADPALLPRAVEEMVRYEPPPVPGVFRHATEDVPVGGTVIPAGSLVILSLAAANRDAGHFPNPDAFDVLRQPNPHLSFGSGIHYCLGAKLARVEGEIAIGALLRRFPELRLAVPAERITRRPLNFLQRLDALPVLLH
ncbi:MAG: cytochrome P450 [Mycobacteriales bacterium]|jgi:cytochrome P450